MTVNQHVLPTGMSIFLSMSDTSALTVYFAGGGRGGEEE